MEAINGIQNAVAKQNTLLNMKMEGIVVILVVGDIIP